VGLRRSGQERVRPRSPNLSEGFPAARDGGGFPRGNFRFLSSLRLDTAIL
jgi:hypothetical protein